MLPEFETLFGLSQIVLSSCVHDLNARNRTPGTPERFKAKPRTYEPLHCAVIVFHEVREIFRVTNDKRGRVRLVVMHDRCRIGLHSYR